MLISKPVLCGYKLVIFQCSNCLPNKECLLLYISCDVKSAFFSDPAFLIHDLPKLNVFYTRMYFELTQVYILFTNNIVMVNSLIVQ